MFELVCEIEPPTQPDLRKVRHQIGVLAPVADSFLIPDNHLGRATVSSIAVAHEVAAMGGRSLACLNARDRNLLGFQRDMLTASAYGVTEFLFVYGDKPSVGDRTGELTVRAMLEQVRALDFCAGFRIGVASALGKVAAWKRAADFMFSQISFSVEEQLRWRDSVKVDIPVYAGVMVLASPAMAHRLAASVPDIAIPPSLVDDVARDSRAGVDAALAQVQALRASGAFHGVHLVPVGRYRETALRLEESAGGSPRKIHQVAP